MWISFLSWNSLSSWKSISDCTIICNINNFFFQNENFQFLVPCSIKSNNSSLLSRFFNGGCHSGVYRLNIDPQLYRATDFNNR